MSDNPYEAPTAAAAAAAATDALQASKALADEIRLHDAAMASDLSALAPRSRVGNFNSSASPANTTQGVQPHVFSATATFASTTTTGRPQKSVPTGSAGASEGNSKAATERRQAAMSLKGNTTTEAYIDKTREIGLVRMSLAAKKAEIRKLEEEIDRAEKRLRQKQEQLESTREKFNSFLKYSNLEQDAAVRRADSETKAKQEKVVEIKKLSARMNHVELNIRKAQLQLESCRTYKKFLDNLAKPKWFQEVLCDLRVADRTEEILLETEASFERRADALTRAYAAAVEERESSRVASGGGGRTGTSNAARGGGAAGKQGGGGAGAGTLLTGGAEEESGPPLVPLDVQIAELEAELAAEAQARVDAESARIHEEVMAMSLDEVKEWLDTRYDESRIPMYFKDVDEFLEVFINVEEGNLFLIQNCQELEEELEAVAVSHLTEKTDTQAMTNQRHAQMQVLADKIAAARAKMKQLEDRATGLERHVPVAVAGAGGKPGHSGGVGASSSLPGRGPSGKNEGGAAEEAMTPEMYRSLVETSISNMFRSLNAGETTIKYLTAQYQRQLQRQAEAEMDEQQQQRNDDGPAGDGAAGRELSSAAPERSSRARDSTAKRGASGNAFSPGNNLKEGKPIGSSGKRKGMLAATRQNAHTGGATTSGAGGGGGGGGDAGANMGAVELLTIIENKIQEYHRYITDPANNVDEALILSVMKNADKERRRQARQEHMAQQAMEHEERSRRALERAQAPVVRRAGKRVLRRSHAPKDGFADSSSRAKEGRSRRSAGGTASRLDDDGAEFFL